MRWFLAIPVALVTLAACGDDPVGPRRVACDPFLTGYSTLASDTVTTTKGVRYIDVEVGDGAPAANGDQIGVNYALYTESGELFQNSCSSFAYELELGNPNTAIEGFQIGVTGMRPGGVRRIILPPELGYPNDDTLGGQDIIFDVQFLYYK